jgi:hypothetical protein
MNPPRHTWYTLLRYQGKGDNNRRRVVRVIKGHLFRAFAENVAALPLAASGLLNPMIAGAAAAFSPVFSLRLRRFTATDRAQAATDG